MKFLAKTGIGIIVVLTILSLLGWILPPPKPPAAGRIVTLLDGMKINIYTQGEGKPIVLVHGLPGSANDWPELADELVGRGYQVTWYDRVGYGHSSRREPGAAFTMQENADELDALIQVLGLDNPALIGWSFGGGVVQSSQAAKNPDTPFIVLLAAVGSSMKIPEKRDSMRAAEWAMRLPVLGSWLTKLTIAARFEDKMPSRWVNNQRSLLLMPGALDTYRGEMKNLEPTDLHPQDIITPTLIIHGTKDEVVPYKIGVRTQKSIAGAKLVTLEGAGHMLPLTHPQQIADAVEAFAKDTQE